MADKTGISWTDAQAAEIERLRGALDAVVCRVRDERLRADKQADAIPHP